MALIQFTVAASVVTLGTLGVDTYCLQTGEVSLEESTGITSFPDWLLDIESSGGSCTVSDNCLKSQSKGNCVVKIDPAKAQPLCSTTFLTDDEDALVIDGLSYQSNGSRSPCNLLPNSDLNWTSTSTLSRFNLCWHDDKLSRSAIIQKPDRTPRGALSSKCFWVNGLCWLWASPCSGMCASVTLGEQHPGTLRYATQAEWDASVGAFWSNRSYFYRLCAASLLEHNYTTCDESDAFSRHGAPNKWASDELVLIYEGFSLGGDAASFSLGGSAAKATGDPHLANVFGQHFDLYQPGRHTLVQVPLGATQQKTLLRVDADARQLGSGCRELYFKTLNVSGHWATDQQGHRYVQYSAESPPQTNVRSSSRQFGKVDIKVVWGRTIDGITYLNLFVRHLSRLGWRVGGLLGEDDHTLATTPSTGCIKRSSWL